MLYSKSPFSIQNMLHKQAIIGFWVWEQFHHNQSLKHFINIIWKVSKHFPPICKCRIIKSKFTWSHFALNTPVGVPACCNSFQASRHIPYGIVELSKSSNNFWKHSCIKINLLLLSRHSSKPKTCHFKFYAYFLAQYFCQMLIIMF